MEAKKVRSRDVACRRNGFQNVADQSLGAPFLDELRAC